MSRYEFEHSHGVRIDIGNNEQVVVDIDEETSAVTWPTPLRASEALGRLTRLYSVKTGEVTVHRRGSEDQLRAPLSDLPSLEAELGDELEVARSEDYEARQAVVWQRSISASHQFEAGVVVRVIEAKRLREALQSTGDKAVRSDAESLALFVANKVR